MRSVPANQGSDSWICHVAGSLTLGDLIGVQELNALTRSADESALLQSTVIACFAYGQLRKRRVLSIRLSGNLRVVSDTSWGASLVILPVHGTPFSREVRLGVPNPDAYFPGVARLSQAMGTPLDLKGCSWVKRIDRMVRKSTNVLVVHPAVWRRALRKMFVLFKRLEAQPKLVSLVATYATSWAPGLLCWLLFGPKCHRLYKLEAIHSYPVLAAPVVGIHSVARFKEINGALQAVISRKTFIWPLTEYLDTETRGETRWVNEILGSDISQLLPSTYLLFVLASKLPFNARPKTYAEFHHVRPILAQLVEAMRQIESLHAQYQRSAMPGLPTLESLHANVLRAAQLELQRVLNRFRKGAMAITDHELRPSTFDLARSAIIDLAMGGHTINLEALSNMTPKQCRLLALEMSEACTAPLPEKSAAFSSYFELRAANVWSGLKVETHWSVPVVSPSVYCDVSVAGIVCRPLAAMREVEKLGRSMGNCLYNKAAVYIARLQAGSHCLFDMRSSDGALSAVSYRLDDDKASICEHLGPNNAVPAQTHVATALVLQTRLESLHFGRREIRIGRDILTAPLTIETVCALRNADFVAIAMSHGLLTSDAHVHSYLLTPARARSREFTVLNISP